ncbi:MAG: peptidoglycan-binding protein [Oscillospiraceae bacterium]|nr:peptidoglycan-binding protein [Oscillospiraceae bacterium]
MKTANDLVSYVKTKLSAPYVYGACGQKMTQGLIDNWAKSYPNVYTAAYKTKALKFVGKQAFDCVNLIKAFVWDVDKNNFTLKGYVSTQDVNADGALSRATVKGSMGNMPDIPGLCVHFKGHIGVYIGNGEVIEARGIDYGVVKTKLIPGGDNPRKWTSWLQFPFVDYGAATTTNANGTVGIVNGASRMPRPALRRGSKGDDVIALKKALNKHINAGLDETDNQFWELTDKAVREFQKRKGLVVDGEVGAKTWGMLL